MSEISRDVKNFVASHISSVAELEALLLLYNSQGQAWTSERLSKEMRSNPSYAEALLERLVGMGLVRCDGDHYVLSLSSDEQKRIVEELSEFYQKKRLSIIDLIYQTPTEKLRVFADAFKIRK